MTYGRIDLMIYRRAVVLIEAPVHRVKYIFVDWLVRCAVGMYQPIYLRRNENNNGQVFPARYHSTNVARSFGPDNNRNG